MVRINTSGKSTQYTKSKQKYLNFTWIHRGYKSELPKPLSQMTREEKDEWLRQQGY